MVTRAQALRLAARVLRDRARELAFDANRHATYGARDQVAYRAYTLRQQCLAAAAILAALAKSAPEEP